MTAGRYVVCDDETDAFACDQVEVARWSMVDETGGTVGLLLRFGVAGGESTLDVALDDASALGMCDAVARNVSEADPMLWENWAASQLSGVGQAGWKEMPVRRSARRGVLRRVVAFALVAGAAIALVGLLAYRSASDDPSRVGLERANVLDVTQRPGSDLQELRAAWDMLEAFDATHGAELVTGPAYEAWLRERAELVDRVCVTALETPDLPDMYRSFVEAECQRYLAPDGS